MGGTVTNVATTTATTVGTIAIADQLRHLHERVPLSERDIARATGADEDTVGAWLARKAVPTGIQANRLMETIAVVEEMALNVRPEGLREWLSTKMPALDGKTPADVIAAGGYEQVMAVALGLTYGAFT
jgi:DNA-binding transcriptional regulator YiaG